MTNQAMKTPRASPRVSESRIQERISQRALNFGSPEPFDTDRPKWIGFAPTGRYGARREQSDSDERLWAYF
jgi:hypothetical protein